MFDNQNDKTLEGEKEEIKFGDLPYIPQEEIADLSSMPPLDGDDEVKEGKGIKILTQNKLLTLTSSIISSNKSWK